MNTPLSGNLVTLHYVNPSYHSEHSQLMHRHSDVLELLYIKDGSGSYFINNSTYMVHKGNLIICSADVLHGEHVLEMNHMESCCCVLNQVSVPGLPANTLLPESASPVLFLDRDQELADYLFSGLYEALQHRPASAASCQLLSAAILNLVWENLQERSSSIERGQPREDQFMQKVLSYMSRHYQEDLQLQDLGETFHISSYHFAHIFKKATGYSPMQYLTCLRIGEAQNLLMNTTLSISAVSEQTGFHDHAHFSSTFKKLVKLTPREYRQHFYHGGDNTEADR